VALAATTRTTHTDRLQGRLGRHACVAGRRPRVPLPSALPRRARRAHPLRVPGRLRAAGAHRRLHGAAAGGAEAARARLAQRIGLLAAWGAGPGARLAEAPLGGLRGRQRGVRRKCDGGFRLQPAVQGRGGGRGARARRRQGGRGGRTGVARRAGRSLGRGAGRDRGGGGPGVDVGRGEPRVAILREGVCRVHAEPPLRRCRYDHHVPAHLPLAVFGEVGAGFELVSYVPQ